MYQMVLVKYHGIIKGYNEDGTPRLRNKYDAGGGLTLRVGEISNPISYQEAQRLKNDFGDAFEIIHSVDMPETQEEAVKIESDVEQEWQATSDMPSVTMDDYKFIQFPHTNGSNGDEIQVTRKQKKAFDKTEKPVDNDYPEKLSKRKLLLMKKKDLAKLYRKWARLLKQKPTLDKSAKKNEYIAEILMFQMAV